MTLFLRVTLDKYELPIAVAESKKELARILGLTRQTVLTYYARNQRGFIEVEVEDEEL